MKSKILLTLSIVLCASTFALAEFPAEEVWNVQFDTTVTCLGPNWQENGQTYFLVGLENQAVIVSAGEIVWESHEFGTDQLPEVLTALSRIDFGTGDGAEIIIATTQTWDWGGEEIWADSGKVYYYNGEDYEDCYLRIPFIQDLVIDYDWDDRKMNSIHTFSNMLPDSSKRMLTCNTTYESNFHNQISIWSGAIYLVGDEAYPDLWGEEVYGDPTVTKLFSLNGDEYLLYGYQHIYSSFMEPVTKSCGLMIIDDEGDIVSQRGFSRIQAEDERVRIEQLGYFSNVYDFEVINDINDDPDIFIAYSDTMITPHLARLSFEDLATEDQINLPFQEVDGYDMAYFPWGDQAQGENMLVCIAFDGKVVAIDPVEMVETERGSFDINCFDSNVGNFDDDELLELVYLSDNSLHLFDIEPLSAPSNSNPFTPTTYTIQSAYPNPFNSKTMIEYSLPRAGRYSLVVYDVNGAEITRLADEWKSAGQYQTVWDAAGVASGTYFIKLGVDGQTDSKAVYLVK